jgi:Holliday junction resolvase RusA-like endonuclease
VDTPLQVWVVGVPRTQGSMQLSRDPRTGRTFAKYSGPTNEWRRTLYFALTEWWAGRGPLQGPVEAYLDFVFPRPQSHFRTGRYAGQLRADAPVWQANRFDLDKLARACLDSMTDAHIYSDDGQVSRLMATKKWAAKNETPGVLIRLCALHETAWAATYPVSQLSIID